MCGGCSRTGETVYSISDFDLAEMQVLIAAYSYEYMDKPVMSDAAYDLICKEINFRLWCKMPEFVPHSGMWVKEVRVDGLKELTETVVANLAYDQIAHIPLIQSALLQSGIKYTVDVRFECTN